LRPSSQTQKRNLLSFVETYIKERPNKREGTIKSLYYFSTLKRISSNIKNYWFWKYHLEFYNHYTAPCPRTFIISKYSRKTYQKLPSFMNEATERVNKRESRVSKKVQLVWEEADTVYLSIKEIK
jgi:hypothetical protein